METFTSWETVPEHLATKSQIGKAGLKLAPGQSPVAVKTGGYGPYDLYDKRTAVPKRATSQAQKEAAKRNIEKARAALACVDCGVYGGLDKNGRCPDCRLLNWITQESRRAGRELARLAVAADYLTLDTETTGLDDTAEIVQIGIVDANGRVLMNRLIRPLGEVDPDATAVHGFDAAALADRSAWPEVYPEVAALLNGRHILAYNAPFDRRIIAQTCRAYGLAAPVASSWTCIMELFAAHVGNWSEYHQGFTYVSLGEACAASGVDHYTEDGRYLAHDAAGDALLVWRLVQAFRQEATAV